MATWRCRRCTAKFAVGLPYCPQCTSTDVERGDDDMPKISRHGGATVASEAPEAAEPAEVVPEVERPTYGDKKAVWVDYAVARHGFMTGAASALTKEQLIELVTGLEDGSLVKAADGTIVEAGAEVGDVAEVPADGTEAEVVGDGTGEALPEFDPDNPEQTAGPAD
jgi:hypothetical protein